MQTIHKRANKGFTLLEILLVIAAIGILAAIVLIAINPTRQIAQVRNAQRRSDINTIYKALEQYLIDNKDYPEGITGTPKAICNNTVTTNCVNLSILVPTYIAAIPRDPSGLVYEVYKNSDNNRIGVKAPGVELSQSLAVNPISTTTPTPEELIQAQITAGTLVPTGTQQLVEGRLVYKNNAGTQTYIDPATTTRTCPTGYIAVPGNSMYGTSEFCVMKYEAKAVAISAPTVGLTTPDIDNWGGVYNSITATTAVNGRAIASVASGYPIIRVSQITAIDYCANQNTVSGGTLITNAEWMTIARNIEAQLSNWTTGTAASSAVGTGGLYRGHSDGTVSPRNSQALAAGPDNDGYIGTGNSGFSIERRTHTLSNGEIIWDLSGNEWEWTSSTIMGVDKPNYSTPGWTNWSLINNFGTLGYDYYRPSNPSWDTTIGSNENIGQVGIGSLTGGPFAFLRGGRFWDGIDGGIFALFLSADPFAAPPWTFRCVVR